MPTPEGLVKKAICDYLKYSRPDIFFWTNSSTGIYDPVRKVFRKPNSPYQINGTADILGLIAPRGRFLAIEVKSETGRLSDDQKSFIRAVNANGGLAFVAWSIDDVIENLPLPMIVA